MVTYSHRWDGTLEDQAVINNSLAGLDITRCHIQWTADKSAWHWEAYGRQQATKQTTADYVMYIDADEIIDPHGFLVGVRPHKLQSCDLTSLANFWYWREPTIQATTIEDSVKIVRSDIAKSVVGSGGRELYVNACRSKQRIGDGLPYVHHYSWVRTKEEMLAKVSSWGHSNDRANWTDLIEQEFSRPFDGTDFLHG